MDNFCLHTFPVACLNVGCTIVSCTALSKHSIVFDGRVIVEENYATTDPDIYAAGPVAMFSQRLGHSQVHPDHASFVHMCLRLPVSHRILMTSMPVTLASI